MLSINEIKKPIAADIDAFEGTFKSSMQSSVPLLDRITHYIVKRKGKQIRPMFCLFFGQHLRRNQRIHPPRRRIGRAAAYCNTHPRRCGRQLLPAPELFFNKRFMEK